MVYLLVVFLAPSMLQTIRVRVVFYFTIIFLHRHAGLHIMLSCTNAVPLWPILFATLRGLKRQLVSKLCTRFWKKIPSGHDIALQGAILILIIKTSIQVIIIFWNNIDTSQHAQKKFQVRCPTKITLFNKNDPGFVVTLISETLEIFFDIKYMFLFLVA